MPNAYALAPKRPVRLEAHHLVGGSNALVVDDSPLNRKIATLELERLGFTVTTAVDGRQALTAIARTQFQLIILDVIMPGMDGLECCSKIRQHTRFSATPVRILGWTTSGAVRECLQSGMDAVLPKPLTADAIEHTLLDLLQRPIG